MRRLRKDGLIAYVTECNKEPVLDLTEAGAARTSVVFKPERFWKRKWNGIWYVLVYDIPEKQKALRNALRGFLKRLRMGCLQRSVWVSPYDVRPEYDDLMKTVKIEFFSFLFESTTVLSRSAQDVVQSAWNFDRLYRIHDRYLKVYEHNLHAISSEKISKKTLMTMAQEEISAYQSAMQEDPLLPHELLPTAYLGFKVFELHKIIVHEVKSRIRKRLWLFSEDC